MAKHLPVRPLSIVHCFVHYFRLASMIDRYREGKRRTLIGPRHKRKLAAVERNDLFCQRQAHADSGKFPVRMKPFEWLKNAIIKLLVNANAVIPDGEHPLGFPIDCGNRDCWNLAWSMKLEGIVQQRDK